MPARQQDLFSFAAPAPAEVKPPKVLETGTLPFDPDPPAPAQPPSVMLIDASGFVFRAYHALPPLTTSKGVPTHAVLGFTRMLLKLMRERKPTHLALCFDKDSRKGRLAIDPNYKANRDAPPPDIITQFALIRKIAAVLDVPILEVEGWEADDVIATMVDRCRADGFRSDIVTSDKDFLQLLAPDVHIYDPMKDKAIDEAVAFERYGIKPNQMRDYQALIGDAIDNIPKVPGIGPKTAVELLNQFGSIEAMLPRLDEVQKPKIRENLKANLEQLKMALRLVSFRHDLDLDAAPATLARREIHQAEARALFTELEFFRLINEMPAATPTALRQQATLVQDAAGLATLVAALENAPRVALAPAYEGNPHRVTLDGLGLVISGGGCFYVDVRTCGVPSVLQALGPPFKRLSLVAHDSKTLTHLLWALGFEGFSFASDVELLSYLMNAARKEHALADLARERLRAELPPWPDGLSGRGKAALQEIPADRKASMFGAAADAIERLTDDLWTEAQTLELSALAKDLEIPLIPVLAKMERDGVRIDLAALKEISVQVDASVEAMLAQVYALAGREFNVGSPLQLAQVLYDELKLPVHKKNKTGASTDHEVLEKLAEDHPLPRAIIEYRNVAKLKNTYLDTLPTLIGADGRLHTTLHQAQAATGRLTSSDPNLQNIPIRTELGKQIRRAFVAEPGHVLISADYSQVELRILAHISGDEGLIVAFEEAADVHRRTAAEVFGVSEAEVTQEQRRAAKMVNYGIAYGLSPHGLSTRLNVPIEEARSIIERYFQRFHGIARYVDSTIEQARRKGYVESLFGRRRYMGDINSKNRSVAMGAERAAINMPIQGTAADIVKRAMLELDRRLPALSASSRMLLQVHDELLFEAPEADARAVADLAREVMTGVAKLEVPLLVDVGIGHSWADAH